MTEKLAIIGMYQLKQKKYVHIGFEGKWLDSFGDATEGFVAAFWGDSGSGKTESAVQMADYLEKFGKVLYLSWEQKDRSTIRNAFKRNGLLDKNKRIFLSTGGSFQAIVNYLTNAKSIKHVFFDSIDYSKLTYEEVQELRRLFPRKNLIFVMHGKGALPKKSVAQDVMFDADMKCHVKKGVVFIESRFEPKGGPFISYEAKARQFHPYLFTEASSPAPLQKRGLKIPKKVKKEKTAAAPKVTEVI